MAICAGFCRLSRLEHSCKRGTTITNPTPYPINDQQRTEDRDQTDPFEIRSLPKMAGPSLSNAEQLSQPMDSELANQFQSAYQDLQPTAEPKLLPPIQTVGAKLESRPRTQPNFAGEFASPFEFFGLSSEDSGSNQEADSGGIGDRDATNAAESNPIWWKQLVNQSIESGKQPQLVDTNALIFEALKNSPRIQAISQNPLIRELQVIEADADFDPVSFVRSQYDDRVDPVGNTLTTGGAPFLEDNIWYGEFGLRRKTRTGASVELSERLGFQNSNSTFFVPQDQATATLALNFSQPLLSRCWPVL